VTGPEDEAATLMLDRRPPELADGDEPADVVIELSPDQAVRFLKGHLALPAAVLAGKVAAYGEVRKYLAVDPILRELLAGEKREEHDSGGLNGDG
jgi:putative sterol carrier protein